MLCTAPTVGDTVRMNRALPIAMKTPLLSDEIEKLCAKKSPRWEVPHALFWVALTRPIEKTLLGRTNA